MSSAERRCKPPELPHSQKAHAVFANHHSPCRLRLQLEDQQAEAAEAAQQQADAAAARLEAAAAAAAEQAVQRWATEALPPLLQPMQEAVAATADLASSVAAEVAGLAGKLGQLADRCGRLEAAHANHEQRLSNVEGSTLAASAGGGPASLQQLEALGQQVHSLQAGHARLDEAVQGLKQQAAAAAQQAAAAAQQAAAAAASPLPSRQSLAAAGLSPGWEAASAAAAELPSLRRQLATLADQQAQQAGMADVLQSGKLSCGAARGHMVARCLAVMPLHQDCCCVEQHRHYQQSTTSTLKPVHRWQPIPPCIARSCLTE